MKNLKNIGQPLTKTEQKTINGGIRDPNPQQYVVCYTITYGYWSHPDRDDDNYHDSQTSTFHLTTEFDPNINMFPVSFSSIIPPPQGC